ncbi:Cro/CI family transcriptional regulator [Pseudomonas tohonis]|uniref:Cro/CI family transcriptional regulator n=1 Tax=Pseudomonas tohonis TaxID=2725477 RepID=UPI0022F12D98|nr:Cro/CI family transcriptional regulator [Pseudomonas tohonis]
MKAIPIRDFVQEKGQQVAASMLGMSQGALSKALKLGRKVFVTRHDDGSYSAEEVRPFPSQQARKCAA